MEYPTKEKVGSTQGIA